MILLGVDPHKSTHTATAVDPVSNQQAGSLRIEASLTEYRRLLTWGRRWPERRWVVENANGLGRHLAQWLVARGESVVDVPPSATSRIPEKPPKPNVRAWCRCPRLWLAFSEGHHVGRIARECQCVTPGSLHEH